MRWLNSAIDRMKSTFKSPKHAKKAQFNQNSTPKEKVIVIVKQNWKLLLVILLAIVLLFGGFRGRQSKLKHDFSSVLMETLNIEELSTSELTYNGIATINHRDSDRAHYYIRYNYTVVWQELEEMTTE